MFKFCLFITLFSVNLHAADFQARFESFEHRIAGDRVQLSGIPAKLLHLPNGLTFSFGDIIAMGDFYGIPDSPICRGTDNNNRKNRFLAAFNALATAEGSVDEANKIITVIHEQTKAEDRSLVWNCLTGGACSGAAWWLEPGRYLLLAASDYDHFGDNAVTAYLVGHEVAMQTALKAGQSNDIGALEHAYAMDAFACHFLTDRFSSGHMRSPRTELPDNVTPSIIGSLLVSFMHNEESAYGLHVHNERGNHWVAYGDGHYLDPKNSDNLTIMQDALQLSVGDIYEAFSKGQVTPRLSQLSLIPKTDENGPDGTIDIAPMFYWDAETKIMMRRVNLRDPTNHHWTSSWMGWSTLAALKLMNR